MQNVDYCFEAFSIARAADQGESGGLAVAGQRQQGRTPRLTPGGETDIPPAGYPADGRLIFKLRRISSGRNIGTFFTYNKKTVLKN